MTNRVFFNDLKRILPPFTFKESLLVVRGFGAMSAGSIGREEASGIGSSRAAAE